MRPLFGTVLLLGLLFCSPAVSAQTATTPRATSPLFGFWAGVTATSSGGGFVLGGADASLFGVSVGSEVQVEGLWGGGSRAGMGVSLSQPEATLGLRALAGIEVSAPKTETTLLPQWEFFAEGGFQGKLTEHLGWRAFARLNTRERWSGGVGLEWRF